MKKLSVLFLMATVLCLVVVYAVCPVAQAATSAASFADDPYAAMEQLCNFDNRTVGKNGATFAAEWLAAQLQELGYVANGNMVQSFKFTVNTSGSLYETEKTEIEACNVVAYKRSGNDNASLLVIGAGFDDEKTLQYGGTTLGLNEAINNASSAATLLSIAAQIADYNDLTFDIAIAFWGATYFEYQGAQAFLKDNQQTLLGYIDLSFVAGGDNLNIYYDETTRTHGNYIDTFLSRYGFDGIEHKPFDPGYDSGSVADYPYGHIGLGANTLFMLQGVPSVHLFGYDWADHRESTRFADVAYTESDTLKNATDTYGKEFLSHRMLLVKNIVSQLVRQADLEQQFTAAKKDATAIPLITSVARNAFSYSVVAVVVVAIVIAGILLTRRSKKAGKPDFSVNSEFVNGQQPETDTKEEDVFAGESDTIIGEHSDVDTKSDKDDFDDIFGEH